MDKTLFSKKDLKALKSSRFEIVKDFCNTEELFGNYDIMSSTWKNLIEYMVENFIYQYDENDLFDEEYPTRYSNIRETYYNFKRMSLEDRNKLYSIEVREEITDFLELSDEDYYKTIIHDPDENGNDYRSRVNMRKYKNFVSYAKKYIKGVFIDIV